MPIALADHTGGLEGVRLSGKAATDLLKLTVSTYTHSNTLCIVCTHILLCTCLLQPEEFLENINPEQRTALKHSLQLERFKIYFKVYILLQSTHSLSC